jgi:GTP 3',8-cyclase
MLNQTPSFDTLGRRVDYLRISITDRCNERCLYCMPEGFSDWKPRGEILAYEEILETVQAAVQVGFKKFRVTGGEPLVRNDVVSFIERLSKIPGVETIGMTTNATRLAPLAKPLREAGLQTINISLDALTPEVYRQITHGEVQPVIEGIKAAIAAGFKSVKLNTVLIRGMNEHEIWPLICFAAEHQITIRFIELMPVSLSEMLTEKNFLPAGEVMEQIRGKDELIPLNEVRLGHGPARYFKLPQTEATVGFIGAITNLHFCESCNKMRLTADGKIRPCLGNHGELDLRDILRRDHSLDDLVHVFRQALHEKPPEHVFRDNYQPQRIMTAIGG